MRVIVGTGPDDSGAYLNLGGTAEVNDFVGNDFTHFYLGVPESGDFTLLAAIAKTAIDGYEEDNYGQTFP